MIPNPGGQIDPKDVIGRDKLISRIWMRLNVQSLSLPAERRVGKTSVLKKMAAEPVDGWVPIFQDLEGISSVNEFARSVYERVANQLSRWSKLANRSLALLKNMGGTEIKGILTLPTFEKKTWKVLLEHVIDDLIEYQKPNRVVFFWDEFPWMLEKIRDSDGEATVRDVLDLLRSIRQTRSDFRVIYTGSIGLHHVLGSLKRDGYGNEPINDLGPAIEVPPLEPQHANDLATRLLSGSGLAPRDPVAMAETIARETGGVPFYIHALIDEMGQAYPPLLESAGVSATVRLMLTKAEDPWDMRHYLTRIPRYYPDEQDFVVTILDSLAGRVDPASSQEIHQVISQTMPPPSSDALRDLLRRLVLDHYLEKTIDQRYGFKFALVKRWWGLEREIEGIS